MSADTEMMGHSEFHKRGICTLNFLFQSRDFEREDWIVIGMRVLVRHISTGTSTGDTGEICQIRALWIVSSICWMVLGQNQWSTFSACCTTSTMINVYGNCSSRRLDSNVRTKGLGNFMIYLSNIICYFIIHINKMMLIS